MKNFYQKTYNTLIFIILIFIFGCNAPDQNMDKKSILIVGLSAEYPPFEFQQQGKIIGFDIDLIQAVGQKLDKEIQIQDMSFHSLIASLHTGKIDVAISGMTITPERLKNVDFTQVYYQPSLAIVYLKNQPLVSNIFSHKKIGVQLGTTMEKWIKQQTKEQQNVEIISLDTNPPLIEKLKLKQIDYIVIETLQAVEFCKLNPSLAFQTVGTSDEGYGIALAKNSALKSEIDAALTALQADGTLEHIQEKWGLKQ